VAAPRSTRYIYLPATQTFLSIKSDLLFDLTKEGDNYFMEAVLGVGKYMHKKQTNCNMCGEVEEY
jgi:hypothetical protein